MDATNPRMGELIAAASAVVLFTVMFLPWFGARGVAAEAIEQAQELGFASGFDDSRSAWQAFGFIDIVLLVTIVVAVASAAASTVSPSVALPMVASVNTTILGTLSAVLVLYRVINPPDIETLGDVGRKLWLYIGLFAAAGVAYGGWRAMQEEDTTLGGEADRTRIGGDPPPPPPSSGPPPASGGPRG